MARRGIPFGKRPGAPGGRGGPGSSGGGERGGGRRPRVFAVSEAVELAHRTLEQHIAGLWVEGEVSNLVLPRSGHAYFTLKDGRGALPTAMWATSVRRLRFRLQEGQRLRVFGRMGIYAAQGRFQLYAERAEPVGVGELALALEQLKRKLHDEGLFAEARKRPLPAWPRGIGVVTSPNGAAVHDIIKVVRRRMPTPILLSPAKVQGPEAPYELIAALRLLARAAQARDIEVIILGRGGGSMEDLWAFNHEGLARAVVDCPVPVVSAVGHEVDVTVCDLVADRRAATPSQAGELVVPDRRELAARFDEYQRRMVRNIERRTVDLGARLHGGSRRLERWGRSWVREQRGQLEHSHARLLVEVRGALEADRRRHRALAERLAAVDPRVRVAQQRRALHELERRLIRAGRSMTAELRPRLARAAGKLDALSPLAVLGRGYALARDEGGRVIRKASEVEVGDAVSLRLSEGQLSVEVRSKAGAVDP